MHRTQYGWSGSLSGLAKLIVSLCLFPAVTLASDFGAFGDVFATATEARQNDRKSQIRKVKTRPAAGAPAPAREVPTLKADAPAFTGGNSFPFKVRMGHAADELSFSAMENPMIPAVSQKRFRIRTCEFTIKASEFTVSLYEKTPSGLKTREDAIAPQSIIEIPEDQTRQLKVNTILGIEVAEPFRAECAKLVAAGRAHIGRFSIRESRLFLVNTSGETELVPDPRGAVNMGLYLTMDAAGTGLAVTDIAGMPVAVETAAFELNASTAMAAFVRLEPALTIVRDMLPSLSANKLTP